MICFNDSRCSSWSCRPANLNFFSFFLEVDKAGAAAFEEEDEFAFGADTAVVVPFAEVAQAVEATNASIKNPRNIDISFAAHAYEHKGYDS